MKGGRPRVLHRIIGGIEYKQCSKCKGWFPLDLFSNRKGAWDGLFFYCRQCNSMRVSIWRKNNHEKSHIYGRAESKCRRSTPKGHLSINISKAMCKALKGNKAGRHWEDLVGYTLDQLCRRLRRTIPWGYTWQDYLDGKLHIDHKIPVSVFNFEKPEDEDFQKCFALKNLQLLPAMENIIKSNKIDRHFQPSLKFARAALSIELSPGRTCGVGFEPTV